MARRIRGLLERLIVDRSGRAEVAVTSDAELLRRFVESNDAEAFEVLVWRHGGMVLGVCKRQLRDEHLAEDAFQAVFLVLARKASTIRGGNVAGWLYRVARRVAARANRQRKNFLPLPDCGGDLVAGAVSDPAERNELSQLLDAEVARLPDRLRLPVLLCYLGGRSTEEVALELGCPRGTVLSRLSTARQQLADRLARRGIVLPAVLTAVGLETNGRLVSATIAGAMRFLAVRSPLEPASILAQGVIRTMTYSKMISVCGVVVAMGLVGGIGWATTQSVGDSKPSARSQPGGNSRVSMPSGGAGAHSEHASSQFVRESQPIPEIEEVTDVLDALKLDPSILTALKPEPKDGPIRKLQRERCRQRAFYVAKIKRLIDIGKWNPQDNEQAIACQVTFTENLLDILDKPADQLKCYEFRVAFLKEFEKFTDTRVLVGTDPNQNHNVAKAARIDAEIALLKYKEGLRKKT